MHINKYNHEKYLDLTAYEALRRIEGRNTFRPLVYICSPFAGDTAHNTENARMYCRFAVRKGCIPIAPHLLFPQFMDDTRPAERDVALFMGIVLLTKCAELWMFGDVISAGMAVEIEKARSRGTPIRRFSESLEEVQGI